MIRQGINKKNFDYLKNEVFIKLHHLNDFDADMKANIICQKQEIEILKDRIIKLEKYAKNTRKTQKNNK